MNEKPKTTIEMTPELRKDFEAFLADREKKEAEAKRQNDIKTYNTLVDETIDEAFPQLQQVSQAIAAAKRSVVEQFRQAIAVKNELYDTRTSQRSHTFTNSKGDRRIMLGFYTLDCYRDTVEEGIALVREAIESLAKDNESRALVEAVLRLLSRDQKGTLKASRVLQLEKLAADSGNERFRNGVRIIKESYQPQISKQYIRAEYKNDQGIWRPLSLGMTES